MTPLPRRGPRGLLLAGILTCGLCGLAPRIASADDGETPRPAPRTAIEIGGASIVLVAASDRLYVFVDRIEDNAPVADAELGVSSADGTTLLLSKAGDGLFVAPFNRAGHLHDAFMVTLRSVAGQGAATAEIAYDDLPGASTGAAGTALGTRLAIALVAAGIGAIASASAVLWLRGGRKRGTADAVGSAQVV